MHLFCSAASGQKASYHNIDMGIVYSDVSIKEKKVDLYADMVRQGIENADIVFFNTADLVLQLEIIRQNKPFTRKRTSLIVNFFFLTIRKYLDFQPYLNKQREMIKTRILNG